MWPRVGDDGPDWQKSTIETEDPSLAGLRTESVESRFTVSGTGGEKTGPRRAMPSGGAMGPMREDDRSDRALPGSTAPKAEKSGPRRTVCRAGVDEPKVAQSVADSGEPSCNPLPMREIVLPARMWPRVGDDGPVWQKS